MDNIDQQLINKLHKLNDRYFGIKHSILNILFNNSILNLKIIKVRKSKKYYYKIIN